MISAKYIHFERKYQLTREEFITERTLCADSINWSREVFIQELRGLRGRFCDGHFSWSIPHDLSPIDSWYTLGFAATFTNDGVLVVKTVYPYYNRDLLVGDEIIELGGLPASDTIRIWGMREPQSTSEATDEVAARNLSIVRPVKPLVDTLAHVPVQVVRDNQLFTCQLSYQKCFVTTDVAESRSDCSKILLQRNGYLSLEAIPDEVQEIHPSLLLYELNVNDSKYCILHPRDFMSWEAGDIDSVMGLVTDMKPDALVIDLKDCSGGAFNQMLYLSHAVGVRERFRFFFDAIGAEGRRLSGVDDFDFISERIALKNSWSGTLIIRSNEICGSGGDFFIRWMKLHDRATILGIPPAGRAGGTDRFILDRTNASISFPLRERIPFGFPCSVEGEMMPIDHLSEDDLETLLDEFFGY